MKEVNLIKYKISYNSMEFKVISPFICLASFPLLNFNLTNWVFSLRLSFNFVSICFTVVLLSICYLETRIRFEFYDLLEYQFLYPTYFQLFPISAWLFVYRYCYFCLIEGVYAAIQILKHWGHNQRTILISWFLTRELNFLPKSSIDGSNKSVFPENSSMIHTVKSIYWSIPKVLPKEEIASGAALSRRIQAILQFSTMITFTEIQDWLHPLQSWFRTIYSKFPFAPCSIMKNRSRPASFPPVSATST